MGILSKEHRAVQNPALGALLLWRFAAGFHETSGQAASAPLPLAFLVLPALFHEETAQLVNSTFKASGLRKFVEKFSSASDAKTDLLLALNRRSIDMRDLTLESLQLAVYGSLLSIDSRSGGIFPLSTVTPRAGIPASVRPMLSSAEKLGAWFSQLTTYEVGVILKVAF
jgi:hypothetical protein